MFILFVYVSFAFPLSFLVPTFDIQTFDWGDVSSRKLLSNNILSKIALDVLFGASLVPTCKMKFSGAFLTKVSRSHTYRLLLLLWKDRTLTILPLTDRRCSSISEIIESPTISSVFLRHLLLSSTLHSEWFLLFGFLWSSWYRWCRLFRISFNRFSTLMGFFFSPVQHQVIVSSVI